VLQRNCDQTEVAAHQIDGQVVGTGETYRRDEITGLDRSLRTVVPCARDGPHSGPELATLTRVKNSYRRCLR
jgi:hypothetical protein